MVTLLVVTFPKIATSAIFVFTLDEEFHLVV